MHQEFGKLLLLFGIILVVLGGILYLGPNLSFLEKLPGNLRWQKGPVTLYFPLGATVLLSIVLTILLQFLSRK
ncbi:DUF2905 domain-containing protein [bacterium]|nr:DUF2905 domain-containing protein [bacterium]MBU1881342.1 DUF2905 domain-containing protein [bacterium]